MRIVIDYQGAQLASSGKHGNGHHIFELMEAIARNGGGHEFVLVLNGHLADSVDEAMARFKDLMSPENFRVWYPPPRFKRAGPGYKLARQQLYEAFIASLKPDVVYVSSRFEGSRDDVVTSVGRFATLPTVASSSDLMLHLAAPTPHRSTAATSDGARPRLAYLSPLPPQRSGIAGYSARLLPELAQHYDIELVTDLAQIADPTLSTAFPVRTVEWFRAHATHFDRVLYQFGNSELHQHMLALLREVPGVVVLHDFDLSSITTRPTSGDDEGSGLVRALYESHGYAAVAAYLKASAAGAAIPPYPCNFEVLAQAQGVIVQSPHLIELAQKWFGRSIAEGWILLEVDSGQHAPAYAHAIERFAAAAANGCDGLLRSVADGAPLSESADGGYELLAFAQAVADALPAPMPEAQLFIDVSELVQRDSKSGIQRVVKSLLQVLLEDPPTGYRIEPVYAIDQRLGYRYARQFTLCFMGGPVDSLADAPIDARRGDVFVGLDLQPHLIPRQREYFRRLRHSGVRVEFVVYDLLPILLKHRFSEDAADVHARWLKVVAENDGALCISQSVADEFGTWLGEHAPDRLAAGFKVRAFHLGADLDSANPTRGLPPDADETLRALTADISFLMVGTVEPRKGHALALDAFEQLWSNDVRVNLVIVGKQGWMVDEIAQRMRRHAQWGKRLFWLERVSDEYLEKLYAAAGCLLAASEGEGFGLPLIESAMHRLPILARNLPVFQEVAGTHAHYFAGNAGALARAVREWKELFETQRHRRSETLPYLTWRQSAEAFKAALFDAPNSSAARRSTAGTAEPVCHKAKYAPR